ncbi:MAG: serine/threonine-protein kinase [Planctomycetota bacterium]
MNDSPGVPPVERAGDRIGNYVLLERIGEGGMGTVWRAEQTEPVRRVVALKIIRLGMDTEEVVARFAAERQALARMDHPNIAKVFDAGSTATGRPYFVMEHVVGSPIVEFCDGAQLDTRSRLALFVDVCGAIQHAHQKGLIHRDVKPSNVLVTEQDGAAVVKVIDFGIAKATGAARDVGNDLTEHDQVVGTPAYMAPEQADRSGSDVDTRADVYSLGVLLYELLTGTTPFDIGTLLQEGYDAMMRAIREAEPQRPSTRLSTLGDTATHTAELRRCDVRLLHSQLKGDLDWIVMRCLEKDRDRRYDSAAELAADVERHLADEPVLAGPPSRRYRFTKYVRRHRGQVAAAAALLLVLVLGAAGTAIGLVRAIGERDRADREAETARLATRAEAEQRAVAEANERRAVEQAQRAAEAEADAEARADELQQVVEFQHAQLGAIDVESMGAQLRGSIVDAAPPDSREDLAAQLAEINFSSIALRTLEANLFERTIAAIDRQFADRPDVRARFLHSMSVTLSDLGSVDLALRSLGRAIEIRRGSSGDDDPDTLRAIVDLGALLIWLDRSEEAEPYVREAYDGFRRALGDDHEETISALGTLGVLQHNLGRLDAAEATLREALSTSRRVLGLEHEDTVWAVSNLGILLLDRARSLEAVDVEGDLAEATELLREAQSVCRRTLPPDDPLTLTVDSYLATVLSEQGDREGAIALGRERVAVLRRRMGDDHPDTLNALHNLGVELAFDGELAEAEQLLRESLAGLRRAFGDAHWETLKTIGELASVLELADRPEEALPYRLELWDHHRAVDGAFAVDTLLSGHDLASLFAVLGRDDEALDLADATIADAREVLEGDSLFFAELDEVRSTALVGLDRFAEAETALLRAYELGSSVAGPEERDARRIAGRLAELYAAWHAREPGAGHDARAATWAARAGS